MLHIGIDEAGYGPTLGPLAVVAVRVGTDDLGALAQACAEIGVRDSKEVHRPGDLAPLERIALPALAWPSGSRPTTAAACFALLGERSRDCDAAPWMAAADHVRLPVAAEAIDVWDFPGTSAHGVTGALVQPPEYNQTIASGRNKADLEAQVVIRLLSQSIDARIPSSTVVDRLGGRRYYRDLLQTAWPQDLVLIHEETQASSRYIVPSSAGDHHVAFLVDGEMASPLTAMASCIAKYARELHMLLLNRWFCARQADLRPTAGYPLDAERWLSDLVLADRMRFAAVLIRESTPSRQHLPNAATA